MATQLILPKCPHLWLALLQRVSTHLGGTEGQRQPRRPFPYVTLAEEEKKSEKCPTGNNGIIENGRTLGAESAVAGDSLWLMKSHEPLDSRHAKGQPPFFTWDSCKCVFFPWLSEISPGLNVTARSREVVRIPEKDEGREGKHTFDRGLHTEQHPHPYVCREIVITLWVMSPTQRNPDDQGGWVGQPGSLYTGGPGGPGGQPGKAAFLEAGLGECCSDGHD